MRPIYVNFRLQQLFTNMKKILLTFVAMLLSINAIYSQSTNEDRYVLYPTKNIWTFLKLDTSNGKIWQVQYSVNGDDYRYEAVLNYISLVLDKDRPTGRFKLYPTDNTYNFVLIDTKVGTTYQVQWSHEPEKRLILPISSNDTLVWSCGYAKVKNYGYWQYYDENGKYLTTDGFDYCSDFYKGYAVVKKNGRKNYIDTVGKYLFNEWYDNCSEYDSRGIAWVKNKGKENYLDKKQKPIFSKWYDECTYDSNGYTRIKENGKYNIIDSIGKILYPEWYDYLGLINSKEIILVEKNGKRNYINLKGEIIFSEWYDECTSFEEGYFRVRNENLYNLVRNDGEILLKEWYDMCEGIIRKGTILIQKDGKWNIADIETGMPISDEWFDDVRTYNKEDIAQVKKGEKWFTINKLGELAEL